MMRVREDRALVVLWLAAARAGRWRETETECVGGWERREPASGPGPGQQWPDPHTRENI